MSKLLKDKPKNKRCLKALVSAVEMMGGTVALSKLLRIHYTNISIWLRGRVPVPIRHAVNIERLTNGKIKAKDLRPDVF